MGKVAAYFLVVTIGIMVPLASWLFFRIDSTERALALEVRRNAAVRQEMRREIDELKAEREARAKR